MARFLALAKLLMVAALACRLGKEQRTAVALRTVAIGMLELIGWGHAQAHGTAWGAVGIAHKDGMGMLVEGNGGNAVTKGAGLVGVPGVEGGIGGDVEGKAIQGRY